jgi:hypothetical protein
VVLTVGVLFPSLADAANKKSEKSTKSSGGSRLEGKILGLDGKPVKNAVVTVRSLDGDAAWSSGPSDSKGRFRLSSLRYGWADLVVKTDRGEFLGDQAINLPPGSKVVVNFNLLETADKPASWWKDRRVEPPEGMTLDQISGMAQSSQKLTGVEYWKSPAGIAIIASIGAVALGLIAAGGGGYKAPATPN